MITFIYFESIYSQNQGIFWLFECFQYDLWLCKDNPNWWTSLCFVNCVIEYVYVLLYCYFHSLIQMYLLGSIIKFVGIHDKIWFHWSRSFLDEYYRYAYIIICHVYLLWNGLKMILKFFSTSCGSRLFFLLVYFNV